MAWRANLERGDSEPEPEPEEEEEAELSADEPEAAAWRKGELEPWRMLESGEDGPVSMESGELAGVLPEASSSSPKKLLIADMAGLRPAMASGVSSSEGISGAENSRPRLSGFDNRPEAKPACRSMLGLRTKNGA